MSDETYVIVGASLAGAKAAETLREEGFTGRVVLIGEETEPPYERPPLSKGYLLGAEPREKAFVHEPQWYVEHSIEWRAGTLAVELDLAARTVSTLPTDTVRYDKLLLATGSRVRTLTAPGSDLQGVRYLRTLDQSDALLDGFPGGRPRGGDRRRLDRAGDGSRGPATRLHGHRGGDGLAAAAPGAG